MEREARESEGRKKARAKPRTGRKRKQKPARRQTRGYAEPRGKDKPARGGGGQARERAKRKLPFRGNTVKIRKVKGENFGFLPLQHLFNFSCIEFVFYILCKL